MIKLMHYDDTKQKSQSHEIYLKDESVYNPETETFNHDIFDICGYGATKEEAYEDFKKKFKYVLNEYKKLEIKIFGDKDYINKTTEVNCFGDKS